MMTKILIIFALFQISSVRAQEGLEAAILLNQEMQFLEASVKNEPADQKNPAAVSTSAKNKNRRQSLESLYFGNSSEEDTINTRMASPRKRSY
jgi:hypothetical protein